MPDRKEATRAYWAAERAARQAWKDARPVWDMEPSRRSAAQQQLVDTYLAAMDAYDQAYAVLRRLDLAEAEQQSS